MSNPIDPILPGATLGILGSGQLGRMFALSAARLGYRVHVFSPDAESPTGQVANQQTVADYDDVEALTNFAKSVAVVTLEFENISTIAAETVAKYASIRPAAGVLHVAQNRLREKRFLQKNHIACAPFAEVNSPVELAQAVQQIGLPAVLKTADSGYDGKGQSTIHSQAEVDRAWNKIGEQPAVLEGFVEYQRECSMLVARSATGEVAVQGLIANDHVNHILDVSMYPLPELEPYAAQAEQVALKIAKALDLIGVACIEFFLTADGELLVNEIAPRPHNSGHLTIEASTTSQFEQQVRAVCGLPLGLTDSVSPAAMVNLLGDLWQAGEPCWESVLADSNAKLHLYGKTVARTGRKMGHLTVLSESAEKAAKQALAAREMLRCRSS